MYQNLATWSNWIQVEVVSISHICKICISERWCYMVASYTYICCTWKMILYIYKLCIFIYTWKWCYLLTLHITNDIYNICIYIIIYIYIYFYIQIFIHMGNKKIKIIFHYTPSLSTGKHTVNSHDTETFHSNQHQVQKTTWFWMVKYYSRKQNIAKINPKKHKKITK